VSGDFERSALQAAVAAASAVPIGSGLAGMIQGAAMMVESGAIAPDLDGQFRYLSGLLLALGLVFAATVPRIERHSRLFLVLTAAVALGGVARLAGMLVDGHPSPLMGGALAMELVVTPALAAWVWRIGRRR
jgi:hypothetical protein